MAIPTSISLPTRQQLDEIDALLKRMLTLPPLPGEPAEPHPPQPPAPTMTYPPPAVREVPPRCEPAPGEPVVREWRVEWSPSQDPSPPPVVAWGSPVLASPLTESTPRFDPAPGSAAPVYALAVPSAEQPPFAAPVAYVPGQPPPNTSGPPVRLPVQLLRVLNGTFDILSYLLGPLGTWLRGPGRNVLGWCGFLMLATAATWAAGEWYGYDWPKVDLARFGLPAGQ